MAKTEALCCPLENSGSFSTPPPITEALQSTRSFQLSSLMVSTLPALSQCGALVGGILNNTEEVGLSSQRNGTAVETNVTGGIITIEMHTRHGKDAWQRILNHEAVWNNEV